MEPTYTLQQLRRAIAKELEMPFFKRYKNGFLVADSGSVQTLVDSDLTQKDKFWLNAWVYRIATQEASPVINFDATQNQLTFEVPITAFAASDQYEIHSMWGAYDIHEAINQAIRDSRRIFFETITDESIIIEENKLAYAIGGLDRVPYMIQKVWLEQPATVKRGNIVSATSTSATLPPGVVPPNLTDNWMISIYAGTGKGQVRQLTSTDGISAVGVATWTTPDSTSKFALWNISSQIYDWYPWHAVRYDSTKEFPDLLYFSHRPVDFVGLRIRLEYVSLPIELTTETSTTVIPESYLMPAAIAILHGRRVGDNKTDRELHFAESRRYQEKAEAWLVRNAPHQPDNNILRQSSMSYQPNPSDPLNWNGG